MKFFRKLFTFIAFIFFIPFAFTYRIALAFCVDGESSLELFDVVAADDSDLRNLAQEQVEFKKGVIRAIERAEANRAKSIEEEDNQVMEDSKLEQDKAIEAEKKKKAALKKRREKDAAKKKEKEEASKKPIRVVEEAMSKTNEETKEEDF